MSSISLIVAVSDNHVIGLNGGLPWHVPSDMARFKKLTMGASLIMGRKTFTSIGKVLPGRQFIVLSRSIKKLPSCVLSTSLKEAIQYCDSSKNIFIIGGENVFREALDEMLVENIYLTQLHGTYDGDRFFPKIDTKIYQINHQESHEGFTFINYKKEML